MYRRRDGVLIGNAKAGLAVVAKERLEQELNQYVEMSLQTLVVPGWSFGRDDAGFQAVRRILE